MGYLDFQIGLYLRDPVRASTPRLPALCSARLLVHAVVNQKHVGYLVALVAYGFIVFSLVRSGIEHNLLVYAAGPGWSYHGHAWLRRVRSGRGCGSSSTGRRGRCCWPWRRGCCGCGAGRADSGRGSRSRGFASTRATAAMAAMAVGLILALGGFIFYNTNVLNEYITEGELVQRRADYERRYGKYAGIPQPRRTATNLRIEIHPEPESATIRGSYRLVNRDRVPIDSVHLEPAFYVETRVTFDRPARVVVADEELGHFIYALDEPLQPGELADAQLRRAVRATWFPQQWSTQHRSGAGDPRQRHLPDGLRAPSHRIPAASRAVERGRPAQAWPATADHPAPAW